MNNRSIAISILSAALLILLIVYLTIAPQKSEFIFDNTVNQIKNNFTFADYEEIMDEQSHVLAPPMEKDLIDTDDNFLINQKLFVYKSKKTNTIILLQITKSKSRRSEWTGSISYSPYLFNSVESTFNGEYLDIPDILVSSNSFTYKRCHFNTTCISSYNGQTASTELTAFSNELIRFLTGHGI